MKRSDLWIPPSAHAWIAMMPSVESRPDGKARWPERINRPDETAGRRKSRLRDLSTRAAELLAAAVTSLIPAAEAAVTDRSRARGTVDNGLQAP
jgi:hypothetical protein